MRGIIAGLAFAGLAVVMIVSPQAGMADVEDCGQPPRPLVSVGVDPIDDTPWVRTTVGITKSRTLTVRAELRCGGPVDIGEVGVLAVLGDSVQGASVLLRPADPSSPNLVVGSLSVSPADLDNTMAGQVPVTFRAGKIGWDRVLGELVIDQVYEEKAVTTVHLYRATRLTIKVTPKRVKIGKAVTVTGKLSRADWDSGNYRGYARRPVMLSYFYGVGGCEKYKTVITGPDGRLKTTFKPDLDVGPLRWTFAGNSTTARKHSKIVQVETTEKEPCV